MRCSAVLFGLRFKLVSGDVSSVSEFLCPALKCPTQAKRRLEWATRAFSPQRAESFRHILLLLPPSYGKSKPQRLKAGFRFGCPTARVELVPFPICRKAGESSSQLWSGNGAASGFRFMGMSSCRSSSSAAQRVPPRGKTGLEWATRRKLSIAGITRLG